MGVEWSVLFNVAVLVVEVAARAPTITYPGRMALLLLVAAMEVGQVVPEVVEAVSEELQA